jgi:hypothetical protein
MPVQAQRSGKPAQRESPSPPYPGSWVDRLFVWIEGRPFPPWLFYLLIILALAILGHIVRWFDGSLSPGSFQVIPVVEAPFAVYFFALIHYLNSASRRALATFRPVLHVTDEESLQLEYVLNTIPRWTGILAVLAGAFLGFTSVYLRPESWGVSAAPSLGLTALITTMANVGAILWVAHTIRQLRGVDRIHLMPKNINPFHREPLYAFSALTLPTAIGGLLPVYIYLFLAYYLGVLGPLPYPSAFEAAGFGLVIVLALAAFILPLFSMHRRLAQEKARLVAEADQRYSAILDRFNEQLDESRFKDLDATSRAIASLASQRDALARISTWPWRPETLRSLLTTLALPVLLYIVSRLVGRLLGV